MQTDVNKNANRNVNKKIAPKKNLAPEKKGGERKPVYKKNSSSRKVDKTTLLTQ